MLEFLVFQLLVLLGAEIPVSNLVAVFIATAYNYVVNRKVTFSDASSPLRSVILYLCLFAFNTTFSTIVVTLLSGAGMVPGVAKALTMACIVVWNYFLYKKVVFV